MKILLIILLFLFMIIIILKNKNFILYKNLKYSKNKNFTFYKNLKYSKNLSINDIIDLHKGQQKMSLILKDFDRICRKYNLKYWCLGGTLIGALRHKGWIPWDGDLDVGMLKEDYKIFKDVVEKELSNEIDFSEPNNKPCSKLRYKNSHYKYTEWGYNLDLNKGLQLDLFVYTKRNNKISGGSAICGTPDKNTRKYSDIFPLKEIMFDNIKVYVPNNYKLISKELWGDFPPPLIPINKRFPHEGRVDPDNAYYN